MKKSLFLHFSKVPLLNIQHFWYSYPSLFSVLKIGIPKVFSIFEAIQNYNAIFLFLLGPQDIQKFYAETVPTTSHSIASYDAQPVLEQFVAGKKIQILISRIFPNFMENYKLLNFGYFSITFKRITFKMNFGFICICAYYGGGG